MTRYPWATFAYGGHDEGGGLEDLQTDVMRFMAILAFCLMAIFALVQSMPLAPVAMPAQAREPVAEPQPETMPTPSAASPGQAPPEVLAVEEPQPQTAAAITDSLQAPVAAEAETSPAARPVEAVVRTSTPLPPVKPVSAPVPAARPVSPPPSPAGFTLQFATDEALMRLVARGDVGVHAFVRTSAWRLAMHAGAMRFQRAAAPAQYHQMSPDTVPVEVYQALQRATPVLSRPAVTWGVSLPQKMQTDLNAILAGHSGGAIVIEASGAVRLQDETQ